MVIKLFGYDLGIDLGSSAVVISMPDKGIVLNEPAYIAYDIDSERIIYAGRRAYYLEGREPKGMKVIAPIKNGVISNYDYASMMLKYYINRVIKKSVFKPRVVASIHTMATDIEKRTLVSVLISAVARSVCLVEKPLCASFGAGLNPNDSRGQCIINIGGGVTDMAIITQGVMSQTEMVKIGGNNFDNEIIRFIKEKHNMVIGKRTSEDIKKSIGGAVPRNDELTMTVNGQSIETGLPLSVEVTSNEIIYCLKPLIEQIVNAAKGMIERTSAQLMADIKVNGIVLTGGSSMLYKLDEYLSEQLEIETHIANEPDTCVALGAMIALNRMGMLDNLGYHFMKKDDVRIN